MKKLLACILTSTCVLCFANQPAFSMKRQFDDEEWTVPSTRQTKDVVTVAPPPSGSYGAYFPPELWANIISFSLKDDKRNKNFRNYRTLSLVDKNWYQITNDETLNKSFFHCLFTNDFLMTHANKIQMLCLKRNDNITDDTLKLLTNLTHLNLKTNERITDNGLIFLTKLTHLNLCQNRRIANEGISHLTSLNVLDISDSHITDDGIQDLTQLVVLTALGNNNITLNVIQHFSNLTTLDLRFSDNEDDEVYNLPSLTRLTTLKANKNIGDFELADLTSLTKLDTGGNEIITGESLKYLGNLISLKMRPEKTGEELDVTAIKDLTNLKTLKFNFEEITDEILSNLTNLTNLFAESNVITDNSLKHLVNLRKLELMNEHFSDDSLTKLTNLKSLSMSRNNLVTDKGIQPLTKLEYLRMFDCSKITNEGIECLTNLQSLQLMNIYSITDIGILALPNLTCLELHCAPRITDTALKFLTKLTSLVLVETPMITNAGIKDLTNLIDLTVRGLHRPITWEGVQNLESLSKPRVFRGKYGTRESFITRERLALNYIQYNRPSLQQLIEQHNLIDSCMLNELRAKPEINAEVIRDYYRKTIEQNFAALSDPENQKLLSAIGKSHLSLRFLQREIDRWEDYIEGPRKKQAWEFIQRNKPDLKQLINRLARESQKTEKLKAAENINANKILDRLLTMKACMSAGLNRSLEDQKLLSILGYHAEFLQQIQKDIDEWQAVIEQNGDVSPEK